MHVSKHCIYVLMLKWIAGLSRIFLLCVESDLPQLKIKQLALMHVVHFFKVQSIFRIRSFNATVCVRVCVLNLSEQNPGQLLFDCLQQRTGIAVSALSPNTQAEEKGEFFFTKNGRVFEWGHVETVPRSSASSTPHPSPLPLYPSRAG